MAAGIALSALGVGTRSAQLRTSDGVRIYLPNTQLLNETIKVYTALDNRRASFDVVLAREIDLDAAIRSVDQALVSAGVHLAAPLVDVNGMPTADPAGEQ